MSSQAFKHVHKPMTVPGNCSFFPNSKGACMFVKSPRKSTAAGHEGGAGRELRAGAWGAPQTTPLQVDRAQRDSEKGRAEQGWQEGGLLTPPHPRTTLRRLPPRPQGLPAVCSQAQAALEKGFSTVTSQHRPVGQTGRGHEISLGSVAFMMIPQHAHTHAHTHPCANAPVTHTYPTPMYTQCLSPHLAHPPSVYTHTRVTHTPQLSRAHGSQQCLAAETLGGAAAGVSRGAWIHWTPPSGPQARQR